ncbi:hypothetical protein JCM33374_g56 [Metschnikowia sp. JCM 33374]|nr:hypothetical protein JCM33374_g56 [Metschnikowia sp. JCM 33374]
MLASKSVSNLASMANDPGDLEAKVPGKKKMASAENIAAAGKDLITYIFPDFKAVEYFRKDFLALNEFHILEKTESSGFEIYLVDQWIRDRNIGSVASVFTGNSHSKVKVCKFTTIKKQSRDYPPRFQEYLNELLLNHATFKKMDGASHSPGSPTSREVDATLETPAYLLVTNISAMPHSLFLIPIPEGDARAIEHRYMVNSNLKKLNCGGRSLSLLAEKVSDASEDKFRQMYCILNEAVPIQFAILELVNIVQTCLFYFDLLDAKYADGLLCHKTEDAINNWWNLIGLPHFNSKPNVKSGLLSSKTVAAIISLTVSVKLRLQLIGGCDVPKDIFDAESFMISVGHFQKQVKIEKRRKLNLLTLSRLFYYTNQNPSSSEKPRSFYSPFGNDSSFDDSDPSVFYDQSYGSPKGTAKNGIHSSNSIQGQTASAYRRNKIFYSKELKKLTNVVKNTVQDHIMVKEDQDDLYSDISLTKPTTKLRSKIASKLSDTLVPADIETTDIETFSKKCIVGKTLSRLWIGLSSAEAKLAPDVVEEEKNPSSSSSNNQSDASKQSRHHNNNNNHILHIRRHRDERDGPSENNGYTFISFRDSFSINPDLHQVADKSGRLGRMKLPFQSRKTPVKADVGDYPNNSLDVNVSKDDINGTLLDTELQKLSDGSPSPHGDMSPDHASPIAEVKSGVIRKLNRRNSYPFVKHTKEANISAVEALQNEYRKSKSKLHPLKKVASFSALEEYFHDCSDMSSYEKIRIDYLGEVSKIMSLEELKKGYTNRLLSEVTMKGKMAGVEVHKIQNAHSAMLYRKSRFETDYAVVLDIKMKDLADNLDKMAFRSRDLLKKIDELDENLSIFKSKLQSESMAKLDSMINRVLQSRKFESVFEDRDEKLRIVKSLTGAEYLHDEKDPSNESGGGIRQFIVFLYELLLILLQVFHFDRSRMNLDRIRGQYKKLDPNRKYISSVYRFIGRDSKVNSDEAPRAEDSGESI